MSDIAHVAMLTEQQVQMAASLWTPLLEAMSNALRLHEEALRRLGALGTEMLQRQQARCASMQHFVERIGAAREATDIVQAQQEWLAAVSQTVMQDATCWQLAGAGLANGMWQPLAQAVARPPELAAVAARKPTRAAA
jgi:hypothetical protein